MPQIPITARYYPALSTVISAEELPDLLGFLKEGLAGLLDSIHYKDLQYSKSVYGDRAFYSLRIVSKDRLDLEIPRWRQFATGDRTDECNLFTPTTPLYPNFYIG